MLQEGIGARRPRWFSGHRDGQTNIVLSKLQWQDSAPLASRFPWFNIQHVYLLGDIAGYIFLPLPSPRGEGNFFALLKSREEFEGGLHKKRKEKKGKKRKEKTREKRVRISRGENYLIFVYLLMKTFRAIRKQSKYIYLINPKKFLRFHTKT